MSMIESEKVKSEKLSDIKVFFTLIKAFCATGILFLPKSFYNGGWLFSSILLIGSMFLTMMCAYKLLAARKAHKVSYSLLGKKSAGMTGKIIIDIFIAVSQFLFVCAYIGFISTTLDSILDSLWDIKLNHWWYGLICLGIYSPMVMVRKI
jgi:proton-coupled amino acid transporter